MRHEQDERIQSPRPYLDISQEIIDKATRKDSGHCVIADAIKAQLPDATGVSVDLQTIRWTDRVRGVRYVYLTPERFQQLLLAFDYGLDIEPQRLRLQGAFQVTPVQSRTKTQTKAKERRETLEAKEMAGEPLTRYERQALTRVRNARAKGIADIEDRPVAHGSPELIAEIGNPSHKMVTVGGKVPGVAVLSHGSGRRRQYGMKLAAVPRGMPAESPVITD